MSAPNTEIKIAGKGGQIVLGKGLAGKTLRVQRQADGSILLTPVAVIPESQLWTLREPHRSAIEKGLAWAAENPPAENGTWTSCWPGWGITRRRNGPVAPQSSRVRLDLNNPQFQDDFFALEASDLKQVVTALRRLRHMEWDVVYSHPGLNWEAVDHIRTPTGAKACSIRLSRKVRAIG